MWYKSWFDKNLVWSNKKIWHVKYQSRDWITTCLWSLKECCDERKEQLKCKLSRCYTTITTPKSFISITYYILSSIKSNTIFTHFLRSINFVVIAEKCSPFFYTLILHSNCLIYNILSRSVTSAPSYLYILFTVLSSFQSSIWY